jgi:hypothetical protein
MCDSSKTSGTGRRFRSDIPGPTPPPGGSSGSFIHGPHPTPKPNRCSLRYLIALVQQANRRKGR